MFTIGCLLILVGGRASHKRKMLLSKTQISEINSLLSAPREILRRIAIMETIPMAQARLEGAKSNLPIIRAQVRELSESSTLTNWDMNYDKNPITLMSQMHDNLTDAISYAAIDVGAPNLINSTPKFIQTEPGTTMKFVASLNLEFISIHQSNLLKLEYSCREIEDAIEAKSVSTATEISSLLRG